MNGLFLTIGLFLLAAGVFALVWVRWYPEPARREGRRARGLAQRSRDAGLRGHYRAGKYEAADSEDQALYLDIGSKIEGEAEFWSGAMLWTDRRFVWVAVPAILIGFALSAVALVS